MTEPDEPLYDEESTELVDIGAFQIETGRVIVSDPSYGFSHKGQILLDGVKNGAWVSRVAYQDRGTWGQRVALLWATHESCKENEHILLDYIDEIYVDSGMAGIFDLEQFGSDSHKWFELCGKIADGNGAGTIPGGTVSSSGMGDGVYGVYAAIGDDGELFSIQIEFLAEEDGENG